MSSHASMWIGIAFLAIGIIMAGYVLYQIGQDKIGQDKEETGGQRWVRRP